MATILIVDDRALNRDFLVTLLGYSGHWLLQASDGVEGLEIVRSQRPQLVITDILMPNMDGYEFVKRMRLDPLIANIPIIFYTAIYREREAQAMAEACGVRWVLPKPTDAASVLHAVNEALNLPDEEDAPSIVPQPSDDSRFMSIDNQLTAYLIELETSSHLMSKIAQDRAPLASGQESMQEMEQRLSKSLSSLQAVSLRLSALIELGIDLAAERDPARLIYIGCRVAQNICVAKYAIVGILDDSDTDLNHFVTCGLSGEAQARLGVPQPRAGILGTILEGRAPYRISGLKGDPKALQLPPSHPPVHSFLGVAIASRDRIYGWLYLVDKLGADEFSEVDERAAATVATQIAVAYENLVLYAETQRSHARLKTEMADRIRLNESLRRFRAAMDATEDAIFLVDRKNFCFLDVNDTACRMLGYTREELIALDPAALRTATRQQLEHMYDHLIAGQQELRMQEVWMERKDGTRLPVELHRRALRSDEGWIIVSVARDITERRQSEQRLLRLAHHDTLTGLPNRILFYESLKRAVEQAAERKWLVAVMFIDLDRFKNVNDTLGHALGDDLLRQFGNCLVQCVRVRDTVGRLGGDEFALILARQEDQQGAIQVARKIMETLHQPFDLKGNEVTVTASIGITFFPLDASDPDTLIKYADTAMYQAKEAGRDAYRFFTAAMNVQALARLELENALRKALENGEFMLYYQPKIRVGSGHISGVEALLRWNRPGHGTVSPAAFIPLLEETGLIVRAGAWVIAEACRQINEWINRGVGPIQVSVNVSARQFFDGNLEIDVREAIQDNGIAPELLELELTESLLMSNVEETILALSELKKLGIQISIDDFGTGYSSLAYLKRFPIDKLKIDIAFVRGITTNPEDAAIALAIIRMAHSLKLHVIAEGVETESQLSYLRRHDCDEIQGYYFSRPVAAHEFETMLREGKKLPSVSKMPAPSQTLLIVDDDVVVLTVLKQLLRQDGYTILTAQSAAEGFEALALNPVQVILCDQCMPDMSGTEFLGKVKDLYPDTVRVVISGNNELQPIIDAINGGAIYRFYTKPWESKALRNNISDAFRHYRLMQKVAFEASAYPEEDVMVGSLH